MIKRESSQIVSSKTKSDFEKRCAGFVFCIRIDFGGTATTRPDTYTVLTCIGLNISPMSADWNFFTEMSGSVAPAAMTLGEGKIRRPSPDTLRPCQTETCRSSRSTRLLYSELSA